MVEEFDKEIDAILRKARENEAVFAASISEPHLDADVLSAFAENALPEKSKRLYTAHLADCDRCRRILSNLISLNAEEEIVPVKIVETPLVETAIPWYRKLFFGRNLVYTMGALVVIFSAFTGFIVLQNLSGKLSSEVSMANTAAVKERGPSAAQEPVFSANSSANTAANVSALSNAALTTANSSANISTSAMNTATAATPSANTGLEVKSKNEIAKGRASDDANMGGETASAPPAAAANESRDDEADAKESKPNLAINPPKPDTAVPANPAPQPKPAILEEEKNKDKDLITRSTEPYSAGATKMARKTSPVKKVSGKTFRYENSVWIDSEYRQGMPITNVSRSTNEYKKLDGGLKNIAAQFNQTVVVVWKSKAYQIR